MTDLTIIRGSAQGVLRRIRPVVPSTAFLAWCADRDLDPATPSARPLRRGPRPPTRGHRLATGAQPALLVRIGPQLQAVLRPGGHPVTQTRFDTGDAQVDTALAELAVAGPAVADRAADGFTALTWGNGLPAVGLRGLQNFLWYQLPYKHGGPLDEQRATAQALGVLFDRLGLTRYADSCRGSATDRVLAAYAADDNAGLTSYRKALTNGGVEPPDLPDLLIWGGLLGVEEHAAFWTVADHSNEPSPPASTPPAAPAGAPPPPR